MFDFRYHVASLAAVFFALVIGILVGVALASHGLGNTERDRLQEDVRRAQARGDAFKAQVDALTQSGASDATLRSASRAVPTAYTVWPRSVNKRSRAPRTT